MSKEQLPYIRKNLANQIQQYGKKMIDYEQMSFIPETVALTLENQCGL